MAEAIEDFYTALLTKHSEIANECLKDNARLSTFARSHSFLVDLAKLASVVRGRPECVCIESAIDEYQYALSALLVGHYRHAFSSLRLTMELLVSSIYFSGHELELRRWENGNRDIGWNSLIDENNGIFSASFVRAFHPFLDNLREQYRALAVATYRECSEFVHGNPQRTRPLEGGLEFREASFVQWSEAVENIRLVAAYVFLYRYLDFAGEADRQIFENLSADNLWHEEEVRACFESE